MVSGMKELYQARKFDHDQRLSLLAKDAQGNFITDQEKSDVVHDLLAFPSRADAGDEQAKAAGVQGLRRMAGDRDGGQGRRPLAQDESPGVYKLQFDELWPYSRRTNES